MKKANELAALAIKAIEAAAAAAQLEQEARENAEAEAAKKAEAEAEAEAAKLAAEAEAAEQSPEALAKKAAELEAAKKADEAEAAKLAKMSPAQKMIYEGRKLAAIEADEKKRAAELKNKQAEPANLQLALSNAAAALDEAEKSNALLISIFHAAEAAAAPAIDAIAKAAANFEAAKLALLPAAQKAAAQKAGNKSNNGSGKILAIQSICGEAGAAGLSRSEIWAKISILYPDYEEAKFKASLEQMLFKSQYCFFSNGKKGAEKRYIFSPEA